MVYSWCRGMAENFFNPRNRCGATMVTSVYPMLQNCAYLFSRKGSIRIKTRTGKQVRQHHWRYTTMALSNLSGWAGSACGASDKPTACGAACGASDKPEEKPAACGSACGASDK